ncbi:recombinase family protein [Roseobacteraceae bacterium S113]
MKPCFGYIRVSTQKQGQGVSLEAQKDAITVFASRNDLTVTKWFEEKETAAKSGRPVFTGMLKQLKQGKAQGVIIHKIDRSARNLRDWAMFSELPDAGVSVYVATESLDFNSRGGRLTADIQAVIAADYIRNLREECIKGMNGRLKQGLYPFRAPIGYLDNGRGNPKTICPQTGPLVRQAFELYSTRQYSYAALLDELEQRGLRNVRGGKLTLNGLSKMLTNQFYIGLMHIQSSGKTYQGIHEPLISIAIWKRVQNIRTDRCGPKTTQHNHLYQGLFRCAHCANPMVPEKQKGRVYYRCTRTTCPTKTIREDALECAIKNELRQLELSTNASARASNWSVDHTFSNDLSSERTGIELQIKDDERRLDRLQDLLLDEKIDVEAYDQKKASLLLRLNSLRDRLAKLPDPKVLQAQQHQLAELQKNLVHLYELADRAEKRMIVENVWPNRAVEGKKLLVEPDSWLVRAQYSRSLTEGEPERDMYRTSHGIKTELELIKPLLELLDNKKAGGLPKVPQWKHNLKNQTPDGLSGIT